MLNFIIRFINLNCLITVITGAFDRLEELADKVHTKVEKIDNDIVDIRQTGQRSINKATESFNKLIAAVKDLMKTKIQKLELKASVLSSEENKARILAKNWKKVMLDNIS